MVKNNGIGTYYEREVFELHSVLLKQNHDLTLLTM